MLVSSASVIPGYRIVAASPSVMGATATAELAPSKSGDAARGQLATTGDSEASALARLVAEAKIAGANAILDMRCVVRSPAEAEAAYLASGRAVFVEAL